MATLGSAFPEDLRRRRADTLLPGAVVLTLVVFEDDGSTKLKYVLLAHRQNDIAHCLLFNSEIHPLVDRVQARRRCQLKIDNKIETYLPKETCFLACDKIHRMRYGDLVEDVVREPACLKGVISSETAKRAIGAVAVSPMISHDLKANIASSLEHLLPK